TPQEVSLSDVRKSINFCRKLNLPVIGVIENMSGMVCPHCGGRIDLFKTGGGEKMAKSMNVPFLGRVPIDPLVVESGDEGKPFVYHYSKTDTAKAFEKIMEPILGLDKKSEKEVAKKTEESGVDDETGLKEGGEVMRFALPTAEGKMLLHFGHCREFAIIDVENDKIVKTEFFPPPSNEPGALPRWLSEQKVNIVIAGGMGSRAQQFFEQYGIRVVVGAQPGDPKDAVESYLAGTLESGANICDH
ncbi:unnamed protein product, partial [marine sediment metagenome]